MKKIFLLVFTALFILALSACTTQSVTCGEGTVIKDGKCVAPDYQEPNDNMDTTNCDSLTGEVFYEANFEDLASKLVDNEPGSLHTQNNFVVWGQSTDNTLVHHASVDNGVLIIDELIGTQLDPYYNSGLGYQFFEFETDKTYTVCTVVEGPNGQSMTSELGIYYGYGSKDEFLLTGEKQAIIQDFMPTLTTNTDRGQYVLFIGNVSGTVKVHSIKIVVN